MIAADGNLRFVVLDSFILRFEAVGGIWSV